MSKRRPALPANTGPLQKRLNGTLRRLPQADIIKRLWHKKYQVISAFLDTDTDFEGHLKFGGTMHLDGRFEGEITAAGGLIIGQKAIVRADIHAADIIICGRVAGKIDAEGSIEIHTSGKVYGDIKAPNIIIHPGAVLVGNCLTSQSPEPETSEPEVIELEDLIGNETTGSQVPAPEEIEEPREIEIVDDIISGKSS